ncbi:hypothetical protein Sjap_003311 [Stephania japonica]|uniref:Uncharacterized protein n=1 Tax=Stephania japonica TaxID=461633 RepID=A0AAP0PWZ8_9MAGN
MYRPHENLDEYEYEDDYEEEGGEEYYEEEDSKPSEAVLEYLEVRQKFKESIRKKLKKENGSLDSKNQDKKKRLPYDNFGSFFGPSQPAIAQRVIQERKSLQETQHMASRTLHAQNGSEKNLSGARPGVSKPQPRRIDLAKLKAQKEKDHKDYSRDYAFLFSDDAELSAPTKEPPRNVSVPKSDARSTQGPSRSMLSVNDHGKTLSGFPQRKLHSAHRPIPKASNNKIASQSRPNTTYADSRKMVASGSTNGSRQPMASKGLVPKIADPRKLPTSSKISAPIMDKKGSSIGVKRPMSNTPKASLPASHSSVQRRFPEQKRPLQQPDRTKPISKPPLSAPKAPD